MNEEDEGLALFLFKGGLIKTDGPFPFKFHEKNPDAPQSPIKVVLRFPPKGNLTEGAVWRIGKILHALICKNNLQYDCVVGIPKAGEPFAIVISELSEKPQIFLEKEETKGRRRILPRLRGNYEKGWRVLIIDDVVVRADSKWETIRAVESYGLVVAAIVVLVDWEHGGKEELEICGYRVVAKYRMTQLLPLYLREGRISPEKYKETIDYLTAIRAYFGKI